MSSLQYGQRMMRPIPIWVAALTTVLGWFAVPDLVAAATPTPQSLEAAIQRIDLYHQAEDDMQRAGL